MHPSSGSALIKRLPVRRLCSCAPALRQWLQANLQRLMQAQSIGAQAVEAMFAVRLADIHAKQHNFDRAAALLQCTGHALGSCSAPAQLCIKAHAAAVRALASQLGGDYAQANKHCQAGIQLASQALQQAGASSPAEPHQHLVPRAKDAEQTSASVALNDVASASEAPRTSGAAVC